MEFDVSHELDVTAIRDVWGEWAVFEEAQGEAVDLVVDIKSITSFLVEKWYCKENVEKSGLLIATLEQSVLVYHVSDLSRELLEREALYCLRRLFDSSILGRHWILLLNSLDEHALFPLGISKGALVSLLGLFDSPGFLAAEVRGVTPRPAQSCGEDIGLALFLLPVVGGFLVFGHVEEEMSL